MNARDSNWGRWGDEDQRGTLNLIDLDGMRRGFSAVTDGRVIDLAIPIGRGAPVWPDRAPPMHFMTLDGGDYLAGVRSPGGLQATDDYLVIACHGTTHIDAFAHVLTDGEMYNGYPLADVRSYGAKRGGVDQMGSVVARGVLLDVAAAHGVESLAPDVVVTDVDLSAAEELAGVRVEPGDAVLVRTGWIRRLYEGADPRDGEPGLGMASVAWLAERDASVIGVDNNGVECRPAEDPDAASPVHVALLRNLGLPMMELLDLEELVASGRREFLFVATPLRIVGGTGSPIRPIAVI